MGSFTGPTQNSSVGESLDATILDSKPEDGVKSEEEAALPAIPGPAQSTSARGYSDVAIMDDAFSDASQLEEGTALAALVDMIDKRLEEKLFPMVQPKEVPNPLAAEQTLSLVQKCETGEIQSFLERAWLVSSCRTCFSISASSTQKCLLRT